jgi:hypothetical protein
MSIYLGSQAVTVYLGAVQVTSPGGAFLDGVQVFPAGPSVPGAPTITSASFDENTDVGFTTPSDGGSEITAYKLYFDGVEQTPDSISLSDINSASFAANLVGQEVEVSAVNAIGEGPKSDPFTVVEA